MSIYVIFKLQIWKGIYEHCFIKLLMPGFQLLSVVEAVCNHRNPRFPISVSPARVCLLMREVLMGELRWYEPKKTWKIAHPTGDSSRSSETFYSKATSEALNLDESCQCQEWIERHLDFKFSLQPFTDTNIPPPKRISCILQCHIATR